MKRKFILCAAMVICLAGIGFSLTGCGNQQFIDTTYIFNSAIISLPNGEVIEGKVESWKDFTDGDQVQIKIAGVTYLVHSEDAVLIADGK